AEHLHSSGLGRRLVRRQAQRQWAVPLRRWYPADAAGRRVRPDCNVLVAANDLTSTGGCPRLDARLFFWPLGSLTLFRGARKLRFPPSLLAWNEASPCLDMIRSRRSARRCDCRPTTSRFASTWPRLCWARDSRSWRRLNSAKRWRSARTTAA